MKTNTGTCREQNCTTPRHVRSAYCSRHMAKRWNTGHPNAQPASARSVVEARKNAVRLLHRYADRKASHEAVRLAEKVYTVVPKYGWSVEQRMATEGHLLRERTDATEVVLRVLTAYVLIDNRDGVYPDARAEWTQVGKLVLYPLSRWRDQGQTRIRVYGRTVTLFGEHAASILAPFCIALLRKAEADDAALAAAVKASTDFDAIEEATNGN